MLFAAEHPCDCLAEDAPDGVVGILVFRETPDVAYEVETACGLYGPHLAAELNLAFELCAGALLRRGGKAREYLEVRVVDVQCQDGESGSLWGPFPSFMAAEDVLFDMAAAFKREDSLVAFTQSSVTFVDKYDGTETCMHIVPGSLGGRLDTF